MVKEREPLAAPRQSHDEDWRERIERAKSAREDRKKVREGKPATFPMRRTSR